MASFDHVLEIYVGNCGRYQKLLVFLISTCAIFSCLFTMEVIFAAGKMDHHCKVPQPLEVSNTSSPMNYTEGEWLNLTVPWVYELGKWHRDKCNMYQGDFLEIDNASIVPCSSFEYDRSLFKSSIVSEWDLVCEKSYYISFIKSFVIAGKGFGFLLGGSISDRFGRKKGLVIGYTVMAAGRVLVTFSNSMFLYLTGTLFTLMAQVVVYSTGFTLCLELVSSSWRAAVGALPAELYALGYLLLSGIAYFCRDRFTLHLANTIPMLLLIPIFWVAPESPRWLLDRGREEDATKVLKQLAERNGRKWPSTLDGQGHEVTGPLFTGTTNDKERMERIPVKTLVKHIFTSKVLVIRVLINLLAWFTANMAYYGLTINIQALAGSLYVNLAIAGTLELGGTFLGYALINSRLGRRLTTCSLYLLSGLALLLILAIPEDKKIYSTALALFGRTCCTAYFTIIYIWTAEIFPTGLRSTSINLSSASGKIGGILAPFLAELAEISEVLPMVLLGAISIISGLLLLKLPETKDAELPHTVDEMLDMGT